MRKRTLHQGIMRLLAGLACSSLTFGFQPSSAQAGCPALDTVQGWLPNSTVSYTIVGGFSAVNPAVETNQIDTAMADWTFHNTNVYNCSNVRFAVGANAIYTIVGMNLQNTGDPGAVAATSPGVSG